MLKRRQSRQERAGCKSTRAGFVCCPKNNRNNYNNDKNNSRNNNSKNNSNKKSNSKNNTNLGSQGVQLWIHWCECECRLQFRVSLNNISSASRVCVCVCIVVCVFFAFEAWLHGPWHHPFLLDHRPNVSRPSRVFVGFLASLGVNSIKVICCRHFWHSGHK